MTDEVFIRHRSPEYSPTSISFDANAAHIFGQLQSQRIQLAKMDARIAAIALSHELILLTRNSRDFSKVTGLTIEDWTI